VQPRNLSRAETKFRSERQRRDWQRDDNRRSAQHHPLDEKALGDGSLRGAQRTRDRDLRRRAFGA
jgi:hypothetical protein